MGNDAVTNENTLSFGENFVALWKTLAKQSDVVLPKRRALTMQHLPEYLPSFVIQEFDGQGLRVKLTGSLIDDFFRVNIGESDFMKFYNGKTKEIFLEMLNTMASKPYGVLVQREYTYGFGKTIDTFALSLPFANENGDFRYLISITNVQEIMKNIDLRLDDSASHIAVFKDIKLIDLGFDTPNEDELKALLEEVILENLNAL